MPGIALSISALPIMGRILLELKLERTVLGALAISAAAIDDEVGWILLAVATAVVTLNFSWTALLLQAGGVVALFFFLLCLVGPLKRKMWKYLNPQADQAVLTPAYLALVLIALFSACLATNRLGVFSIFGAFLMGVALHKEVSLVRVWREKFADFMLGGLVPVFFTYTGLPTQTTTVATLLAAAAEQGQEVVTKDLGEGANPESTA